MIKYLILGVQRSGTTMLHTLLMQHPNISVLTDELRLIPSFELGLRAFTFGNESEIEKKNAREMLFEAITTLSKKDNVTHCGAKACTTSFPKNARRILGVLKNSFKDMRIIYIERQDLVAQYGSLISLRTSGIAHSWSKGAHDYRPRSLLVNPLRFVVYAFNCLEISEIFRLLEGEGGGSGGGGVYRLNYEDLVRNISQEVSMIFEFLHLNPVPVKLNSKKVMPDAWKYIRGYSHLRKMEGWARRKHLKESVPWYVGFAQRASYHLRQKMV